MKAHATRTAEIFFEAKALPAGPGRERFLIEACGGDQQLRAEVNSLLEADSSAEAFLEDALALPAQDVRTEGPGERIGPYLLREQIGEGGFGVVWAAEQEEPVRRAVALKIIKLGMDTREVVARFEQERQALAMMDHPNIARVFDAGATERGRPFFVMELVRGNKITDYCNQANLPTTDRLELFIQVCHAVQHAHQKGIIHRDLKPSNILVTLHDGVAVPKVIDFGVAKATQGRVTEHTIYTQFQQMIGTPLYMSPEQAQAGGGDVDTRTDIYALGVLLYELLTGSTPFDAETFWKAGHDEMRRIIREEEPQTPSMFLEKMANATRTTVAQQHRSDPERLAKMVRGDLDWIVMKALDKDRGRRYESATGLARDIERHLASEPVLARPTSLLYRFRRLVKRNKLAFAAGTALMIALLGGLAVSTWLFLRAEAARRETERNLYAAMMGLAQAAWDQANIGRLREILEDTSTYPDRGFEWFYWQRQLHLDLRTLRGHTSLVRSVAFSPDGRRILTGSADKTAKLWDAESGRELLTLTGHRKAIASLAFSPNGARILMASGDYTAKIFDTETGRELLTLKGHSSSVLTVAYSSDGRWILTGSADKTAKLWDAESGRELLTLKGNTSGIESVAISPDGRRILTGARMEWLRVGGDKTAKLWDTETGRELLTVTGHSSDISSVAFSPDGRRILTGSEDHTARTFDTETGRALLTLAGHSADVTSAVFSPDGRWILTGSGDKTAKLWDAETGRELLTLKGHSWRVEAVTFSPDGRRILTGSGDGTIKIWEAEIDREPLILSGHPPGISSASYSPDGREILTTNYGMPGKTWDAETGRELSTLSGQNNHSMLPGVFSPNGRWILMGSDSTAQLWGAKKGGELLTLTGHESWISSAAFSPDSQRILTGSIDKTARTWNTETGRELMTLKGHTHVVQSVAYSPDGRRVLTGSRDKTARIWDPNSGRELLTLKGHTAEVSSVAFSPDGRQILTGSGDYTAKTWDTETGRELLRLKGHANGVKSVAFSSDGRRILTGSSDESAKLWDAESGRELLTLKGHTSTIVSVAFSPDGRRILTGGGTTAKIWRAASLADMEAWRKEDEVNEREQRHAEIRTAQMTALNLSVLNKNWNEAAAKLAVVEKMIPEKGGSELDLIRFKILIGQRTYPAAYQLADQLSNAHPDDAELQNELAWTIITDDSTKLHDLDLVEKLATRANDAAKGRAPPILDTLARVLFIRGKKAEAIQLQIQAVTLEEGGLKEGLQKTLDSYRKDELPKP